MLGSVQTRRKRCATDWLEAEPAYEYSDDNESWKQSVLTQPAKLASYCYKMHNPRSIQDGEAVAEAFKRVFCFGLS